MSADRRTATAEPPTPKPSHRARLAPIGRRIGFCRHYDADLITFAIITPA